MSHSASEIQPARRGAPPVTRPWCDCHPPAPADFSPTPAGRERGEGAATGVVHVPVIYLSQSITQLLLSMLHFILCNLPLRTCQQPLLPELLLCPSLSSNCLLGFVRTTSCAWSVTCGFCTQLFNPSYPPACRFPSACWVTG
jgi:hypothetical protein